MQTWTPAQVAEHRRTKPDTLTLLDVREPWEYQLVHLEDSVLIPLGQLMHHIDQLPAEHPVAILCHHGVRSAQACYLLERSGFDTINIAGGIDRWAREIDSSMPIY